MSIGASTWEAAPLLTIGTVSEPTPRADLPMGSASPFYSAWWKLAPTEDVNVVLDSIATTTATGVEGYCDTILVVYTAAQLAAEPDPDLAEHLAYNDDGIGNGRSQIDLELTAGETYYVRLGNWGFDDVVDYVLTSRRWFWSEWITLPVEKRTEAAWDLTTQISQTKTTQTTRTSSTPSNATLSDAVFDGYASTSEQLLTPTGDAPALSSRIDVSVSTNIARTLWSYKADAGVREATGRIRFPDNTYSQPSPELWPEGAFAVEVAGTVAEVVSYEVDYTLTEASYDESATGGLVRDDALGTWSYTLESESSDSVTIAGPLSQGDVVQGTIAALVVDDPDVGPVTRVTARLALTSVEAHDPGFGLADDGNGGGNYAIGNAGWFPVAVTNIQPPLVRFKVVPSDATVSWWDGTARQDATVLGWWDGSAVQPVTLLGWWDGTTIQPILGGA